VVLAAGPPVSAAVFQTVFDDSPFGYVLFDADGRFKSFNRALLNMLGVPAEELVGLSFAELVHSEDSAEAAPFLRDLNSFATGRHEVVRRALRLVLPGDRILWVNVCGINLQDSEPVRHGLAVVENITDRRNLEQQLVLNDRIAALGVLAAGIAHKVNNPLGYVQTSLAFISDEIKERARTDPEAWADVSDAMVEGRQGLEEIARVVRDLKVFAETGAVQRKRISVCQAIDAALVRLGPKLKTRAGLSPVYASDPFVWASDAELAQLFGNLLINAVQAIAPGKPQENEISIFVNEEGDQSRFRVEISDTGTGVADSYLEKSFWPFESTKKGDDTGPGLGLFVCRSIVEALGGGVAIQKAQRGTTAIIILPRAA
jgi:two-component system NtrC family sensor kinase